MSPKAGQICVGVSLNLLIISVPLIFRQDVFTIWLAPPTLIFYVTISLFCMTEIWSSNSEIDQSVSGPTTYHPHFIGLAFLGLIWLAVYQTQSHHFGWALNIIGCFTMIAGIALRTISIRTLKTQFLSQIQLRADHTLLRSGIYAVIRHPSELGLLLIGLGIPLLLSSPLGLIALAFVLAPLSLYRIGLEDKLLHEAFTKEFSVYKATTPALFPKLHRQGGHNG